MIRTLFSVSVKTDGDGVKLAWDNKGRFLATCGSNRLVQIHDRAGELFAQFSLPVEGRVRQLEWDVDGSVLAVLQDGNPDVALFLMVSKELTMLQTNLKDPTLITWSKEGNGAFLAVASAKGNLLIYNKTTRQKVSVVGKHSKAITCGAWNSENLLALGGADRCLTVSDVKGATVKQDTLGAEPKDVQFADQKSDERASVKESTVSVCLDHKKILLYNMVGADAPVDLSFQSKYGDLVSYRWFGDGYIVAGFSKGYVVSVSTHMREVGSELHSLRLHATSLNSMAYSPSLNLLATAGDDGVRLVSMLDWKEVPSSHRPLSGEVAESLWWTRDGQILTIATSAGNVYNHLMRVPLMSTSDGGRILVLSSLRTASVAVPAGPGEFRNQAELSLSVEPGLLALGPDHAAACLNSRVWFYRLPSSSAPPRGPSTGDAALSRGLLLYDREYPGSVKQLCVGAEHAAALVDGRVVLHRIASAADLSRRDDGDDVILPDAEGATGGSGSGGAIAEGRQPQRQPQVSAASDLGGPSRAGEVTCIAMAGPFLVMGTARGKVIVCLADGGATVSEFSHSMPLASVAPTPNGTRIALLDSSRSVLVLSPVDDTCLALEGVPAGTSALAWDHGDARVLLASAGAHVQGTVATYLYRDRCEGGPQASQVAVTKLPAGYRPALYVGGVAHGQSQQGQLLSLTLASHDALAAARAGSASAERRTDAARQLLALGRVRDAWLLALEVRSRDLWQALGRRAIELLDVDLAVRAHRELGDASMVMALQRLEQVEDLSLLAGHAALLLGDTEQAQKLFLASSRPVAALEMRRDLLQWDQALRLAAAVAPEAAPGICLEYGLQLEGGASSFADALAMFQRGLASAESFPPSVVPGTVRAALRAGVARATLRTGDLVRGRELALATGDRAVMRDCAGILEAGKHLPEAAALYLRAEAFERAATLYILMKDFVSAAPLLERLTAPKLHAQYAKAKEAEGSFQQAADAYERANDLDSVVRLCLRHLNQPRRAFEIVRRTRSAEGAELVAEYAQKSGDFRSAIEFLLVCGRAADALALARSHDQMEAFAEALGADGTREDYMALAEYHASRERWQAAGRFSALAGEPVAAVGFYLRDEALLPDAIAVVRENRDHPRADELVRLLHDYLVGDTDGRVKDPRHIYALYVAIGNFAQAGPTAVLIADQEQMLGNYKVAHDTLLQSHRDLVDNGVPVPEELERRLLVLHSYALVKRMVRREDHAAAARLLLRVAGHISKFPRHVVPILTSTVIECQRAGLRRSSFDYASVLMRPEYRNEVDEKYKRKIEAIVRRRPTEEEEEEGLSPCPHCGLQIPHSVLDCPGCRNSIPYCSASGRHMVAGQWSSCPSCHFPALRAEMEAFVDAQQECPMCDRALTREAIVFGGGVSSSSSSVAAAALPSASSPAGDSAHGPAEAEAGGPRDTAASGQQKPQTGKGQGNSGSGGAGRTATAAPVALDSVLGLGDDDDASDDEQQRARMGLSATRGGGVVRSR